MHSVIHWKKLFCIVVFLVGEGGMLHLTKHRAGKCRGENCRGWGGGGEGGGLDVNSISQRRACCLIIVDSCRCKSKLGL